MKKNTVGLLVSLFTLLIGLSGCVTATDADTVRVGSYNIRFMHGDRGTVNAWDLRREDVAQLIRKMELDAFGLQEVCPEQLAYLRGKLPEFEFVGEHREADRKSGEASPVAYRKSRFAVETSGTFWLSETPDVPGVKGWGAACPRVCSYLVLRDRSNGKRLCFANAHTDHISAEAREKGMLLVIERMKRFGAGSSIVFVGDHNCRETAAPARAVSALLNDAMRITETPPRGAWRTFNGWKWRETEPSAAAAMKMSVDERNSGKDMRIDYIYVSAGIRVLDMETVDAVRPGTRLYPSDHFPLVATIALP